jgi:hypothetical protein
MKSGSGAIQFLASILLVSSLHTPVSSGGVKEYQGILYNERCLKAQPEWLPYASEHSLECALMEACFLSGYHLVVDEKTVFKLDRRGEMLARRLLLQTKKKNDFRVRIRGRLKGSELLVQTLEEIAG